jgi:7,8-dihydropterin-6-yl-methyl-4-(beta-D-ribofuranosyl)aminobenzene 5'-phosphate synthase
MLKAIKKPNIPVIAHPDLFRPNFVLKPFLRSIGMLGENTKENIEKNGGKLILTRSPFSLMYGLISTGEIGKKVDFEEETKPVTYTIDQEGKIQEDKVLDDISLIVSLPDGVVVISGCSHAGIVSILERAKEIAKEPRIKAVIGGFHLIDADKERIDKTLRQLEEMKVGKVYAGHCTGIRAECKFLKKFGNRFVKLHCGKIIEF